MAVKENKIVKALLKPYSIVIIVCAIILIASIIIFVKEDNVKVTEEGIEIIQSNLSEDEEITEEQAIKQAKKQFDKLGEKDLKEEQIEINKIRREDIQFYYITSPENSLEIKIKGGEITRINSVLLEE